jgi:hypothetical protein
MFSFLDVPNRNGSTSLILFLVEVLVVEVTVALTEGGDLTPGARAVLLFIMNLEVPQFVRAYDTAGIHIEISSSLYTSAQPSYITLVVPSNQSTSEPTMTDPFRLVYYSKQDRYITL